MPRVTVITPTYQHAAFIECCVRSVLAQTMTDWEMIVVDDGSTDGTAEIAESIGDSRITILRRGHQGIQGIGSAYAMALARATSPFIGVLEGDDAWPPTKLEDQLPLFDDRAVVLTFGPAELIDEFGCVYARTTQAPRGRVARNEPIGSVLPPLAEMDFIVACTVMVRRAALEATGGFLQPEGVPYVDHPTWLRLATVGTFARSRRVAGYWRRHPDQQTTTSLQAPPVDQAAYLREIADQAHERLSPGVLAALNRTIERSATHQAEIAALRQARLALLDGRWSESIRLWRRLLRAEQPTVQVLAVLGIMSGAVRTDVEWLFRITGRQPWPSRRHRAAHFR